MYDASSYTGVMSIITVRIDDETQRALDELTSDGTTVSDAVRAALVDAATRHAKHRLSDEIASIAADPEDRREAERVLRDMEILDAR